MKNKMLGLRSTIYKVKDLKKATDWYTKAFNENPYFNESYYVGFNIGGYELGLLPESEPLFQKSENVLSYWGVVDVEKSYDRLIKQGASPLEKPSFVGGEIVIASVKDPWGNVIGIISNPDFKPEVS